jgi:hypothetical protein
LDADNPQKEQSMANATDLTLSTDGSTGTRVFKPVIKDVGSVLFIARDTDVSAADATVKTLFRPANNSRKTTRFSVALAYPLKRSDGGSPATYTAPDVARVQVDWVIPVGMSQAERETLSFMANDMVSEAIIQNAIDDLDPPV